MAEFIFHVFFETTKTTSATRPTRKGVPMKTLPSYTAAEELICCSVAHRSTDSAIWRHCVCWGKHDRCDDAFNRTSKAKQQPQSLPYQGT